MQRIFQNQRDTSKEIMLAELPEIEIFQKVVVQVKAIVVKEQVQITEKVKQDVIVANSAGSAKVTLWKDQVGCFELGRSYLLMDFLVHVYLSNKYISRGKGSELRLIDDIGPVAGTTVCSAVDEVTVLKQVTIIGVPELDSYKSCLKYKARVELLSSRLGCCSKADCKMKQRLDLCQHVSSW